MLNKKMTVDSSANNKVNRGVISEHDDAQTDETLLFAYAGGEMPAFELLYSRHKKALFNHLRRQCSNASIAEELAHDVWLAVIKQASSFEPKALFKTWLYRIAHNRLVDYWRKNGHSKQVLLDDLIEKTDLLSVDLGFVSSKDRSVELIEIEQLLSALSSLSAEQTSAVLLKVEGFTCAEIAQITHSKKETVKSRLRYATKHLRLSMEAS